MTKKEKVTIFKAYENTWLDSKKWQLRIVFENAGKFFNIGYQTGYQAIDGDPRFLNAMNKWSGVDSIIQALDLEKDYMNWQFETFFANDDQEYLALEITNMIYRHLTGKKSLPVSRVISILTES